MCKAEEDCLLTISIGIDLDKSAGYNNIVRQKSLILSTRDVTKISSCQVNTTSRQGIEQLGISFGYNIILIIIIFYFPMNVAGGHIHSSRGNPQPPLLMIAL